METSIIKIGNSKGLRLSKTILEKYDIKEKVDLILEKDRIIIVPHQEPRKDWDKAFKKMRLNKDDKLIVDDVFPDEDFE
ncbi:MAG: AbrB/MazE/SpoVT family DNA-binding domain-containing protein [Flavobacteriales bacterium]|nr:AbrB/MazE/SpoVT family DNA-binding domain-containing protein [Flavobacteriales bacterium]